MSIYDRVMGALVCLFDPDYAASTLYSAGDIVGRNRTSFLSSGSVTLLINDKTISFEDKLIDIETADGILEIKILQGSVYSIKTSAQVYCDDVLGDISANGNVQCGDVSGDVTGNDINCDDVGGDVQASGNVNAKDVSGDIDAGGNISCDDVGGDAEAQGNITCKDINGDVEAYDGITCETVYGDVSASGTVKIIG